MAMPEGQPRTAVIYVRISKDRDDQTSTDSQERVCRDYAEGRGWDVVAVKVDRGRSAFKSEGKRPGLDAAMKLAESGAADVLVVWKLDRFVRSVAHFGKLWPRLESAGASFVSVTDAFDTTTAMGRAMLQIAVVFAELESAIKSERILAWHEQRRVTGAQPTGPRPYGYERDEAGEFVVVEAEAEVIRSAADVVLAGGSLRSIVRRLNADAVPTSTGGAWSGRGLKHILTSPTTAGLRDIDGAYLAGSWPAILARGTWDRLRSVLMDPARRTIESNAPRWMLTGIASCGRCGDTLRAKPHPTGTRYTCRSCWLSAPAEVLDELVSGAVIGRLDGATWQSLQHAGTAPAVDTEALEAELAELAEMYAAGDLSLSEWRTMRAGITTRSATSSAQPADLPDVTDLAESWSALPVDARQLVLSAVVESILILPARRGANRFDPDERVRLTWKV